MNLKHITFTGIDAKTDLKVLREIQERYPIVEWGVLTSYHWYENGNRYLDTRLIKELWSCLNLSLHICGLAASNAAWGFWRDINHLVYGKLDKFSRIQLNIAKRKDNPSYLFSSPSSFQTVIIQQRNVNELDLFKATIKEFPYHNKFSVLLDASGGRGIDTHIDVLKEKYSVGYAGGINSNNVEEKLTQLYQSGCENFWIDMESGVRTDDWFDVNKVVKVLEICQPIIEKYEEE